MSFFCLMSSRKVDQLRFEGKYCVRIYVCAHAVCSMHYALSLIPMKGLLFRLLLEILELGSRLLQGLHSILLQLPLRPELVGCFYGFLHRGAMLQLLVASGRIVPSASWIPPCNNNKLSTRLQPNSLGCHESLLGNLYLQYMIYIRAFILVLHIFSS